MSDQTAALLGELQEIRNALVDIAHQNGLPVPEPKAYPVGGTWADVRKDAEDLRDQVGAWRDEMRARDQAS